MKPLVQARAWLAGLGLALLLPTGCTVKEIVAPPPQIVVEMSLDGEPVEVPIPTKGVAEYKSAVNPLAYKQWPQAIQALEAYLTKKPKDWRARYALAVAQEANGDFASAKANYIEADRMNGGGADLDCVAGAKRIEMRGR